MASWRIDNRTTASDCDASPAKKQRQGRDEGEGGREKLGNRAQQKQAASGSGGAGSQSLAVGHA